MPELILDNHKAKTPIDHPDSSITQAKLAASLWDALEKIANKGVAGGYAELDSSALIPTTRIPNLTRSKITDFFNSPFWANIPDKPSSFPPSTHASTHAAGGSDAVSLARSQITDFFATPFWNNIPDKPSGFLKKIAEVSPTSNVTYFDVTGLDINTHKFYLIFGRFKNATASAMTIYMFVEGDTNNANYVHRYFYGDGSTAYTGQNNYATFCDVGASGSSIAMVYLVREVDGTVRWTASVNAHGVVRFANGVKKTTTVTNITQLRFQSSATNGIAAGSRVVIFGSE